MKKLLKYGVASLSLVALNLAAMAVSADTAGVEPPVVVEDTTSLTNSAVPASSALVEGVTASADTATTGADSQTDAAVELSQWTIAVDLADGTSHVVPIPKAGILPIHVPGIGEAEIWLPTGWADTDTAPENVSLVHYTSDADTPRLVLSRHGGGLPQEDGRFLRFYSLTTRHDPKLASEQPATITVSGNNGVNRNDSVDNTEFSKGQEQGSAADTTVTQFTQPTTDAIVALGNHFKTLYEEYVRLGGDIQQGHYFSQERFGFIVDGLLAGDTAVYSAYEFDVIEKRLIDEINKLKAQQPETGNGLVTSRPAPQAGKEELAITRNQLSAQVDKSSLTDAQKGELAVKITFAETAEELDKIKAELTRLTVPAAKPASVDTPAETSTKTLPATGDSSTETLVAMGLTLLLASLGLSKIRKTV